MARDRPPDGSLRFVAAKAPTDEEVELLLGVIRTRVLRLLVRRGLLCEEARDCPDESLRGLARYHRERLGHTGGDHTGAPNRGQLRPITLAVIAALNAGLAAFACGRRLGLAPRRSR